MERTIGKRDFTLAIDDILLKVESDTLCRADILHRLRYCNTSVLTDVEETIDCGTRCKDYRRMVENVYSLATELLWGNAYNFDKRVVVNLNSQTL